MKLGVEVKPVVGVPSRISKEATTWFSVNAAEPANKTSVHNVADTPKLSLIGG